MAPLARSAAMVAEGKPQSVRTWSVCSPGFGAGMGGGGWLEGVADGDEGVAGAVVGVVGGFAEGEDRGDAGVAALQQLGPVGAGAGAEDGGQALAQLWPE